MLLRLCILLTFLPMTISGQHGNHQISSGTKIPDVEILVTQLINSKLENLDLASKQDLSELERKFEAKTEMLMSAMNEQEKIVNRIKSDTRR